MSEQFAAPTGEAGRESPATEVLRQEIGLYKARLDALRSEAEALRQDLAGERARADALRAELIRRTAERDVMLGSASWRAAARHLPGALGRLARPPCLKLAVVLHLAHDERWTDVAGWVRGMPLGCDLYVAVPHARSAELRRLVLREFPAALVAEVADGERDVAAFLAVLPAVLMGGYTAICTVHTRRRALVPDAWRQLLLQGLLPSPRVVRRIVRAFHSDPGLFLVGPKELYLPVAAPARDSRAVLAQLIEQLYSGRAVPAEWGFFAGPVLWVRPEGLEKLAHGLRLSFESEGAEDAPQAALALERTLGLIAAMEGKRIGLTSSHDVRPASHDVRPAQARLQFVRAPGRPAHPDRAAFPDRHDEALPMQSPAARPAPIRRWSAPRDAEPGVNLIAPVEIQNGLGASARGYASCLMHTGLPVNVVPWRHGFDHYDRRAVAYPSREPQPINLVHLNLDHLHALSRGRATAGVPRLDELWPPSRYNIAIIYWELASIPPAWLDLVRRFDEIWCASSFLARSVEAVATLPVRVVRPALVHGAPTGMRGRRDFGLPPGRFVFCYVADAGSILGRKNPRALIEAYLAEFSPAEGACCVVKLHHSSLAAPDVESLLAVAGARPDLVFLDGLFEEEEMSDLFESIDCYVSPHRSEGLGLTVLEAMFAEKPVIATPYGGVTDVVNDETSIPLAYRLVEVGEGNAPYPPQAVWADPEPAALRAAMRSVFSDRAMAASRARRGKAWAEELFSPDRTAEVMRGEIGRICRRGGRSGLREPV